MKAVMIIHVHGHAFFFMLHNGALLSNGQPLIVSIDNGATIIIFKRSKGGGVILADVSNAVTIVCLSEQAASMIHNMLGPSGHFPSLLCFFDSNQPTALACGLVAALCFLSLVWPQHALKNPSRFSKSSMLGSPASLSCSSVDVWLTSVTSVDVLPSQKVE